MSKKPRHVPKERPADPHAAGTPWRLFIAVPTPEPVQALIAGLITELDRDSPPVRWSAAGSTHLTLHFLGEVDPSRGELLRLAFGTLAAGQAAFDLETSGLGFFPEQGLPDVLWLGLGGETRDLTALHRAAGVKLRKLDLEPEQRVFRPHITLGRVRAEAPANEINAMRERALDPAIAARLHEAKPLPVREIQLVRSYLERSGARHEVIAAARLTPKS